MKKPKDNSAQMAREDEAARQAKIREGTTNINTTFDAQFNPEYFGKRKEAFLNYATPQLNDQYGKAQKELTYSLDRAGTLDSSIRAEREAELQKLYETNRRSVADQGLSYENNAKSSVEEARADLIRTLNATGDAQGAANSAISRAQVLSQPDVYSPLAQLFTTFTSGIGQQAQLERASSLSGGAVGGQYNTGLFGTNKKAVQVS
jgi:hypothetical protein